MSKIQSMTVGIRTADEFGADTSGDVFVGVCGREFLLTRQNLDVESGSSQNTVGLFARGSFSNFIFDLDDPDFENSIFFPKLDSINFDLTPIYIRLEPKGVRPNLKISSVSMVINTETLELIELRTLFPTQPNDILYRDSITLGKGSGLYIYLSVVVRKILRQKIAKTK